VLTYLAPDALQVVAPSSVRNPVDEDKSPDRVFVQWYGILGVKREDGQFALSWVTVVKSNMDSEEAVQRPRYPLARQPDLTASPANSAHGFMIGASRRAVI